MKLAAALEWLGAILGWLAMAIAVVACIGYGWERGFWALLNAMNPFDPRNWLAVAVLFAPSVGCYYFARRLRERRAT